MVLSMTSSFLFQSRPLLKICLLKPSYTATHTVTPFPFSLARLHKPLRHRPWGSTRSNRPSCLQSPPRLQGQAEAAEAKSVGSDGV